MGKIPVHPVQADYFYKYVLDYISVMLRTG